MIEYMSENLYLNSEVETVANICKMLDLKCTVKEVKDTNAITCYNVTVQGKPKYKADFLTIIALMFKIENER